MTAQPVGPWTRDPAAYDPSAQVRTVEVDGRLFAVHNLLGPGWPMTVSHASGGHIGMAGWENWDDVASAACRHVEADAARGRS